MSLTAFLHRLRDTPQQIEFSQTIEVIDVHYLYTPTAFRNGEVENAAGQNGGSCKIFAFAKLHRLSEPETLACFGRYYREDVLQHPDANDHQNIRNFMRSGWATVVFDGQALQARGDAKGRLPGN
ncbi:MAG: HopJ type III effector protein [Panacagrimonas sp.]